MQPAVEQFLLQLPEQKRKLALQLHDVISAASPKITASIKWNSLTYSFGKVNIAFIYEIKDVDYINLGFMYAVELSDPKKLFEGTGKGMRHIKVRTTKDIPASQIKKWFKEAILLRENKPAVT